MTRDELQKIIRICMDTESEKNGKWMLEIAEAYIDGEILQDKVAAEAWLAKAIMLEDATSILAMGILCREILGKEEVLSDEDYKDIYLEYQMAGTKGKKELEELLSLSTDAQRERVVNSLHI